MRIKTPSTEGLEYHSPEWFRMCALIEEGVAAGTGWQWRPRGTVRPMTWEARTAAGATYTGIGQPTRICAWANSATRLLSLSR